MVMTKAIAKLIQTDQSHQILTQLQMGRDAGMQVAKVDATGHVKLQTVTIARDMGAAVDISSGVSPKDRIIDNPADALQDGDEVKVAEAASPDAKPAKAE